MSREIQIEINATMDTITDPPVAFILKNRRRKKFIITIPNTIIHTQIIEGTRFFYNKNQNNHLIWAKGPVLAEMIILVNINKFSEENINFVLIIYISLF